LGKSAINAVKAGIKLPEIKVIKSINNDRNDKRASPAAKARGIFFDKKSTIGRRKRARSRDKKIMKAKDGINQNKDITNAIDTTIKKDTR